MVLYCGQRTGPSEPVMRGNDIMTATGMAEATLLAAALCVGTASGLPVDFDEDGKAPDPLVETTPRDDAATRQWVAEPGREEMTGIAVTRRAGGTAALPIELLNAHSWGVFDAVTSDGSLGWFRMLIGDFVTLAERSGRAPWVGDAFAEDGQNDEMGVLASGKGVGDIVLKKHGDAMVAQLKSSVVRAVETTTEPVPEMPSTFNLDPSSEKGTGFSLDPGFNPDAEGATTNKQGNPVVIIMIIAGFVLFIGLGLVLRPNQ